MSNATHEKDLSLLAATIFADHRVYSSEITVFVRAASRLDVIHKARPNLSEAKLLVWYEENKEHIKGKMTAPYFKDWFYDILEKLSDVEDKRPILAAMKDISRADSEIHVSERALFTLAARHWGLNETFTQT